MYIGVKKLIQSYKKPFNREVAALKKAKARLREEGKKATEKLVEEEKQLVLAEWDRKTQFGTEAHEKVISRRVKRYPTSIVGKYVKFEGEDELPAEEINKLEVNTRYYEKLLVDNQNHIIGYADEVFVDERGYINIQDFKSHDEIRRTYTAKGTNGFIIVDNFYYPIKDLVDCNFNECALQASIYMYILWTYNKRLKPGKLTMLHTKLDPDTGSIMTEEVIELPYLVDEVKALFQHLKEIK